MKVPINWLKDYVDINVSPKELGDILTLTGSKVEEIITNGEDISNVVVSQIKKLEKHPDADKLFICQADIEKEVIQIVTAATNMKEGDKIPVALHGSRIYGGKEIKKGKLRGILSNGMFCSTEELGLPSDGEHGLMILPDDAPIGEDIKEYLKLNSSIIDFEITSNRPDCLSVIGIARETSASLNTPIKYPNIEYKPNCSEKLSDNFKVVIKSNLCKRYTALGIKNVKIEESSEFIKTRLSEAGIRCINNIVDITNFVMLEYGIPIHAFDRRQIKSNSIVVDIGEEGEVFTTLDDIERKLPANCLRIKDGENTIGIAGIMGGLNSEIREDTTEVIIEVAKFDGYNIRTNSNILGLRTEASTRFEKGLDEDMCETVQKRIASLVLEYNIGEIMDGMIDVYEDKIPAKTLEVSSSYINKFLGIEISREEMKNILDRLELFTEIKDDLLIIKVPTFRGDIEIKEDITEEIARIYGYNNIPITYDRVIITTPGETFKQKSIKKLEDVLIGCGLSQSINYSFVSPRSLDRIKIEKDSPLRDAVVIRNPLGEDFSIMRTSTIPSMLEGLARNYLRSNKNARLFEIGKRYFKTDDKLPDEVNTLTIGIYGDVDFFDLKGIIENILEAFKIKKEKYQREVNEVFHPGKCASLVLRGKNIGVFGEIHPDILENYDIGVSCYVAELNLDLLIKNMKEEFVYTALPKYPSVTRDISILIDDEILAMEVKEAITSVSDLVESATLIDIYKGSQIPDGKKSITFNISYRSMKKTLTDEEINTIHAKIVKNIQFKFNAELR